MFNVGDEVEWKGWTTVITKVTKNQIWGLWNKRGYTDRVHQTYLFYPDSNITLIQPAMMQYDPNQQGDKEDDI